jgi:hypothetical protein
MGSARTKLPRSQAAVSSLPAFSRMRMPSAAASLRRQGHRAGQPRIQTPANFRKSSRPRISAGRAEAHRHRRCSSFPTPSNGGFTAGRRPRSTPSTSCCTQARRFSLRLAPAQDPDRAGGRVRRRAPVRRAPPPGRSRGEPRRARGSPGVGLRAPLPPPRALRFREPARAHRIPRRGARLLRALGADQGERLLGSRARLPPFRLRRGGEPAGAPSERVRPRVSGPGRLRGHPRGRSLRSPMGAGRFLEAPDYGIFEVENALAQRRARDARRQRLRILFRYLGRFVLPLHLSGDESAWSIRVVAPGSRSRSRPPAGSRRSRSRLSASVLASPLALGFLFFCLALLPASNLLFFTGTIFAERIATCRARAVPGGRRYWRGTAPTLPRSRLPAQSSSWPWRSFWPRAVVRNAVWWSDEGLFLNLVRTAPDSARRTTTSRTSGPGNASTRGLGRVRDGHGDLRRLLGRVGRQGRMELDLRLYDAAEKSYRKAIDANADYENGYSASAWCGRRGATSPEPRRSVGRAWPGRRTPAARVPARAHAVEGSAGPRPCPTGIARSRSGPRRPRSMPTTRSGSPGWAGGRKRRRSPGDSAPRASRSEFPPPPGGARQAVRLPVRRGPRAREDLPPLSSAEDWKLLLAAAQASEAYGRRLAGLKDRCGRRRVPSQGPS